MVVSCFLLLRFRRGTVVPTERAARPIERCRRECSRRFFSAGGLDLPGENQRKGRADAHRALDRDVTAHGPCQVAADCESQTDAVSRLVEPSVSLHERLENVLKSLSGNPGAGI